MKIVFLAENPIIPFIGGIERVTYLLSKEFEKRGHEIHFISSKEEESFKKYCDRALNQYYLSKDIKIKEQEFLNLLEKISPDILINQNITKQAFNLLKLIKSDKIKKISVYHNMPFSFYGKEKKIMEITPARDIRSKILKYWGIFSPNTFRKFRYTSNKNLIEDFLRVSDKIYLLAESYIGRIKELMPEVDINKFDVINNPNTFELAGFETDNKENLLIFVGRLEDPQKNVKDFIDVWCNFYAQHKDWKAIIAGDGPHRKLFEDYANKKEVKCLEFVGNSKDVSQFYKRAKLLVMTSTYEGWPMVLAESMAYGCVPVAYDSFESVYEIIKNNETGYVVPSFEKKEINEKLKVLANDDELREKMAYKGMEHLKKFEAHSIAETWMDKLNHLRQ